jgi:hypothetical protein
VGVCGNREFKEEGGIEQDVKCRSDHSVYGDDGGRLVGSDLSDINDKDKRYDMGIDKESV